MKTDYFYIPRLLLYTNSLLFNYLASSWPRPVIATFPIARCLWWRRVHFLPP